MDLGNNSPEKPNAYHGLWADLTIHNVQGNLCNMKANIFNMGYIYHQNNGIPLKEESRLAINAYATIISDELYEEYLDLELVDLYCCLLTRCGPVIVTATEWSITNDKQTLTFSDNMKWNREFKSMLKEVGVETIK